MHGHNNGRFPASLNLRCRPESVLFLGLHRARQDFSNEDMEVLGVLHGPLAPALSFRHEWEKATRRLEQLPRTAPDRLTPREAQVLALVSRGWTNRHIGHVLGITERTVRKASRMSTPNSVYRTGQRR
jgi:DNA-binding CsgD family transcriptional regulator